MTTRIPQGVNFLFASGDVNAIPMTVEDRRYLHLMPITCCVDVACGKPFENGREFCPYCGVPSKKRMTREINKAIAESRT